MKMKLEQYQRENLFNKVVVESIDLDNMKIVLLKDDDIIPRRKGRKNLVAIDKSNNLLWIADLPSDSIYASYQTIEIDNGELYALSGSFLCTVDIKTGKVISDKFVK